MEIITFRDNILHGDYISYSENGEIRINEHFINGLIEGENIYYYEDEEIKIREKNKK